MRRVHDTESGGRRRRAPRWLPAADPSHRYPRVTSARVLAALFDVAVGLRLLWPDNILGNPLASGYRLLDQHFYGDVPLGLALLAFGAVMTAGLYTDRGMRVVAGATWLSLMTWLLVAVDIALVSISQIGSLVYVLVAVMNGYAYAHLTEWRAQIRRRAEIEQAYQDELDGTAP